MASRTARRVLSLAAWGMLLAPGGPARGQVGPGGTSQAASRGSHEPQMSPRGSAVPMEEHSQAREEGGVQAHAPGGLSGGRGRQGGTIGSPHRPRLGPAPGDPSDSRLGLPIGASGGSDFALVPGNLEDPTPLPGDQPGPVELSGVPRVDPGFHRERAREFAPFQAPEASVDDRQRDQRELLVEGRREVQPPEVDPLTLSPAPRLDLPTLPEGPGPAGGLALDDAIGLLLSGNLHLQALAEEIPKARADALTASYYRNPSVGFTSQYVPYGHYDTLHPGGGGGQPEYQAYLNQPIDVSGKRRARMAVADRAARVTEAQYADIARKLVDNLYTAFVNALAARVSLRYGQAYLAGIERIAADAETRLSDSRARAEQAGLKAEQAGPEGRAAAELEADLARQEADEAESAAVSLRAELAQGRLQVAQAKRVEASTLRALAQVLNLDPATAGALRVRGLLGEPVPPVPPLGALVERALERRPDLAAYQLGIERAEAEVDLAKADRISDVNLFYQPYTLQGGRAFGVRGTYSFAVGFNANLPLFDRNRGNIDRARSTARQTRLDRDALARQIAHEVAEARDDLCLGMAEAYEIERAVLPAARAARDSDYAAYRDDPSRVDQYLRAQEGYNRAVQQHRDALIELRQAMLDLDTAVGERLMP